MKINKKNSLPLNILIFILFGSFFNCSKAKAADISDGKKLYPKSEKIYLLS